MPISSMPWSSNTSRRLTLTNLPTRTWAKTRYIRRYFPAKSFNIKTGAAVGGASQLSNQVKVPYPFRFSSQFDERSRFFSFIDRASRVSIWFRAAVPNTGTSRSISPAHKAELCCRAVDNAIAIVVFTKGINYLRRKQRCQYQLTR